MGADPLEIRSDAGARLTGALRGDRDEARYRWAAGLAPGRRVLDAGCGPGVGLRILAGAGPASLTGVDRGQAKLDVIAADGAGATALCAAELEALPFDDGAFDVIVCLGPLVSVADPAAVLSELRRVMSADGVLLASVPVTRTDGLARTFTHTHPVSEARLLTTTVGTGSPALAPTVAGTERESAEALMLASDHELPVLGAVTVFGAATVLEAVAAQVRDLHAAGEALAARLRTAQRALDQRDEAARTLRDAEARLAAVPDLEARLLEAERRAELAQAEAERAIARVKELGDATGELEAHRTELHRAEAKIDAITNSASWRVTAPIRRISAVARRGGPGGAETE